MSSSCGQACPQALFPHLDTLPPPHVVSVLQFTAHQTPFTAIITLGTWDGDRGVVNTLIVQRRKLRSRNKILHVASHQWCTQMGTLIPPLWYSSPPHCLLWEWPPGFLTLTVTLWAGPCGLITSSEADPLLEPEFTPENPTPTSCPQSLLHMSLTHASC